MHKITLISTAHTEKGKCNSNELYKILEEVDPEVIFDELPGHYYEKYFFDSFDMNYANSILLNRRPPAIPLEVKCLKRFMLNHNVEIVPVDIDIQQELSAHQDEIYFLFETFFRNQEYHNLDYEKDTLIQQEGFHFLNSSKFLDYSEKKEVIERSIIEPRKEKLITIYNLFRKMHYDHRENSMLQSIYKYSIENQYCKAVFLIGAEHKRSIVRKIAEYQKQSEIKLNWTMYTPDRNSHFDT